MQNIGDILSGLAFFATVIIVVIAILNFVLRLRILNSGHQDEAYIRLLSKSLDYKGSALKWAIMLFFGGLGLVVITFVPIAEMNPESPLPYGVEAIFLAIGFFVYYTVARKDSKI